jgi:hypothetical protein
MNRVCKKFGTKKNEIV